MHLRLEPAASDDVEEIAALRTQVAEQLTRAHGKGHWSQHVSVKNVRHGMRTGRVFIMRRARRLVATLRLSTTKPWAIDPTVFMSTPKPLYLTDMAVAAALQRHGFGRQCLHEAERIARAWPGSPAGAIRLDAYDAPAGAGPFYEKCGYREVGRAVYRKVPLIYYECVL